jgi:tetratricopeptide repeat protein
VPALAYYNRANIIYGTQDYDKAIHQYYNQALKLQPNNVEALDRRCGARIKGELRAALDPKPNNVTVLDHRGMPYLKLGQPATREQLRRGAQTQPELAGGAVRPRRRQADEGRRSRQQR